MRKKLARPWWEANLDLASACLDHSFVQGIGDGALPRENFPRNIAQDAFFLESFGRAYALALAHAPDRRGLYAFAELLQGGLEDLLDTYAEDTPNIRDTYRRAMQLEYEFFAANA